MYKAVDTASPTSCKATALLIQLLDELFSHTDINWRIIGMDRHHEREIEYYPMEGVQIQPLEQSVSPPGRRESTQSSIRDRIIRFTSPVQLDYSPLSPLSNDKSFSDERQPQGHSKGNSLVSVESKYSAIHPVHQQFLEASPTSPPAVLPKSPPLDIADSVKTWWGWWHPMFLMYVFFLLGVAAATGHHFYYASLHGTEVTDQFKRARYGKQLFGFLKNK